MYSASMVSFLFLVATPLLLQAQHNQQTPLKEYQPELVIPLTLSDERTYTFVSALDGIKMLSSKAIEDIESFYEINSHPETALIHIPLDAAQPGTMVLDSVGSNNARIQQKIEWIDTLMPGDQMPITYVGIRKGAMVSKDAYTTRLTLETPYLSLPGEIYDILIQATNPTRHQHGDGYDDVVDCGALNRYPDLVLGLQLETDEEENDEETEEREIVITPEQYVLKTEQDRCILLAQRVYQRGRDEVVLGWAAVRGHDLVLDWVNERTGFGK